MESLLIGLLKLTSQMAHQLVEFSSPECGHITDVDLPDFGSVLTVNDNIPIDIDCEGIQYNLESSDGGSISVSNNEIQFAERGTKGVLGLISGTIECSRELPLTYGTNLKFWATYH